MSKINAEAIIAKVHRRMTLAYFFWYAIYVVLGILTVLLPLLMTLDAFAGSKEMAVFVSIIAAIFAFLKPHEYATGYDAGKQEAWKTQIAYALGQIDEKEVSAGLSRALDVTTFKYGGKAVAKAGLLED